MADVSFEEEKDLARVPMRHEQARSGLADALVKNRLAATPEQANLILLVFAIIIIGVALYLFLGNGNVSRRPTLDEPPSLKAMQASGRVNRTP